MAEGNNMSTDTVVILLVIFITILWTIDRFQHDRIEGALGHITQQLEWCK